MMRTSIFEIRRHRSRRGSLFRHGAGRAPGGLGENGEIDVGVAQPRGNRSVGSPVLLVDNAFRVHVTGEPYSQLVQALQRKKARRGARLHVEGAPSVQPPLPDAAAEEGSASPGAAQSGNEIRSVTVDPFPAFDRGKKQGMLANAGHVVDLEHLQVGRGEEARRPLAEELLAGLLVAPGRKILGSDANQRRYRLQDFLAPAFHPGTDGVADAHAARFSRTPAPALP
jgi:hypothetical protein